ncbi:MAG: T9SS type A sorting domain-containing protein [Muribaculaceae bacterium]|nr:T9SS type A sorting domain-containing protein [Muribaculaceae bacterium]
MKRLNLLALFVAVCAFASAQSRPTHEQYVSMGSTKAWYNAYNSWNPGTALYNGTDAAENEQFFISRVKPRKRFNFTGTQVKESLNPDRKLMWWCPLGEGNNGNWNGIPSYWFGGEVYSMWSYTDIYGNWTAPMIQAPAAFLDACHKNGVRSGVVAAVPFGAQPTPNDGGHGSNINALVSGGADKLLKYLRYYGVDGIGFNSEFSWSSLNASGFKNMMGDCYSKATSYGVPFNNAWYSFTSNAGGTGDYSVLNSGCVEWFHYNGKTVSDAYFLNYNWGSSQLATSQSTAQGQGRSGFDVYGGMDYQGRNQASFVALKSYDISFGLWGAHNMNMFYESRGELGATAKQLQKTYQLISENSFTGSSYNPVNTPQITDMLRHSTSATSFHGFSSFITARSTMMPQYGDATLAGDPFVTYFNLGNGMFFNDKGVTTFNHEWYNLGVQDYLPSWRWWWTKTFMGKTASSASTDMVAEFTWDDAWFGGSCLQISGATTAAYLQLFKTKYAVKNNDVLTVRYKVVSGSGNIKLAISTEANPTTEISSTIVSNAKADEDTWVEKTIKVAKRGGLNVDGQTLALIGLKFENTTADFKVLIGEISLTRGTSVTPGAPSITMSKTMARNYKGVDMKVVFDMTSRFSGSRQNYESIYNSDVKTSLYKIYTQQEGCDAVLCTATTSWAAYVVGAPYDATKGGKIRIGVSAVSMDGKSESSIAWGSYNTVPASSVIEGFSIDKPIIKAGEQFTVSFDDPGHAAATWVIKASANDAVKGTFNAKSFTTSLSEEGIYDLYLTMNGTTEVYRGKIQISPAAVGALPRIESFKADGQEEEAGVQPGGEVEFTYTGRQDADGYVSRGIALQEKAFGIKADQLNFNDQSPFSMTFWVYFNQFNHESDGTQFLNIRTAADGWPASDWGYVWSMIAVEGGKDDGGNVYKEGNLIFNYRLSNNAGEPIQTSTAFQFKPETWYHVALCMGYSNNRTLSLYINGQLIGSSTATKSLYTWKSSNVIMIGGRAFSRAGIDGTLDEVRLYNKVLTADEVKASMQHTSSPSSVNGLIGYWDFETDANADNNVISPIYYNNKQLKSGIYEITTVSEGNNQYLPKEITYAAGAPFISGTNYKIETLPTWKFKGGSILSSAGNKSTGSAKVVYTEEGNYPAILTLSNGWGSDTKQVQMIVETGIEDVTLEEMRAFPNPFENEVYVAFAAAGDYTAEIYDYTGRLINTLAVSAVAGAAYEIPVDGESGIYFIKVKGEAGLLSVMKVVKK